MTDIEVIYENKVIFHYSQNNDSFHCPFCGNDYSFNNIKIRDLFNSKCASTVGSGKICWSSIMFRCVECSLNNETYPFKLSKDVTTFNPDDEQKIVISNLYQELLITSKTDQTHYLFLLEGEAGTGKTSTIMYLFKYPEFRAMSICFSASTNKALSVMMDKLNISDDPTDVLHDEICEDDEDIHNKRDFKTIFRLTKSKTSISSCGETIFEMATAQDIEFDYDIIVIDEVSMIEKKQLEQIMCAITTQNKNITGRHTILIFMGDMGQLPPVGEDISMIFDGKFQMRYALQKWVLREIMRSHDNLTDLSRQTRQLIPFSDIVCADSHIIKLSQIHCPQINVYFQRNDWINKYVEMFKQNLLSNDKNNNAPIILVYTNNESETLNCECREKIFNHPTQQYVNNELLIFKSYYCLRRHKQCDDEEGSSCYYLKFFTSEPVIVEKVSELEIEIIDLDYDRLFGGYSGLQHMWETWLGTKVNLLQFESINNRFKQIFISSAKLTTNKLLNDTLNSISKLISKLNRKYYANELSIDCHHKIDRHDTNPDDVRITVISQQSLNDYMSDCDKIRSCLKTYYQHLLQTYGRDKTMKLVVDFLFQKIWKLYYYRIYVWPYANMTYGYAMTIHKSQGSTYKNTFINIPNILNCRRVNEIVKAKSEYTAITRASDSVNIYHTSSCLYQFATNIQHVECVLCHNTQDIKRFHPINHSIDINCASELLKKISPYQIVELDKDHMVFSDQNKVLHRIVPSEINVSEIHESDINEVIEYVRQYHPTIDVEKYQYSNIMLIKELNDKNNLNCVI